MLFPVRDFEPGVFLTEAGLGCGVVAWDVLLGLTAVGGPFLLKMKIEVITAMTMIPKKTMACVLFMVRSVG